MEMSASVAQRMHLLRYTAIGFAAALASHVADHINRGTGVQSRFVLRAGAVTTLLAIATVILVFRSHRWAPIAAMVTAVVTALVFSALHFFPRMGAFGDSYLSPAPGAGVTWFSWLTAAPTIAASFFFGWAGLNAMLHARAGAPEDG